MTRTGIFIPGGGMEGWRDGSGGMEVEGWRDGRMEGWKNGGIEGWRDGGVEGWRDGVGSNEQKESRE
jgi:hypothetical protein